MRIAIDLRTSHRTGVYRYGLNIAGELLARFGDNAYLVLHDHDDGAQLRAALGSTARSLELFRPRSRRRFFRDDTAVRQRIGHWGADVYYSANYLVDPAMPVPTIATIHDLIRLKFPELSYSDASFRERFGEGEFNRMIGCYSKIAAPTAPGNRFLSVFHEATRQTVAASSIVVTSSQASKRDLLDWFGRGDGAKMEVVPGAACTRTFRGRPSPEVAAVNRRFGVAAGYVLYVGLIHPHKRFDRVLEAFEKSLGHAPPGSSLLVVGDRGAAESRYGALLGRPGLRDSVIFAPGVSDSDLARLYTGARALVTASADEGFGLPVLEALSCGTEVIATDVPALRENFAAYCHLYPSADPRALEALVGGALNGTLARRNVDFRSDLSWRRAACRLMAIMEGLGASDGARRAVATGADPESTRAWTPAAGRADRHPPPAPRRRPRGRACRRN